MSATVSSTAPATGASVQLQSACMEYVRLGNSGLMVSRIGLGCMTYGKPCAGHEWVLDFEQPKPFYKHALERGINFFDTSDTYSSGESERVLGATLKEFGTKRSDIVIATKVYYSCGPGTGPNHAGLSRKHISDAIDASLERLQLPYVDLYQTHGWDKDVTAEELMEALHDVVKSKARYIGASNLAAWQ